MMKRLYTLIVFSLVAANMLQSQDSVALNHHPGHPVVLSNITWYSMHLLYDRPPTPRELVQNCRHLTLDVDATGFFFDAEYATPYAKGYTVTGFRFSPTLAYGINEKALLQAGFNATAFAGLDSLYNLRPTFSLVYAPTRWLTLVAGTIYGSHTHQLAPPVYDPSRWIYNYQEDGLQILTKTKHWNSDTWLDWSHYLTPWTADQERFTMGSSHLLRIINKDYRNSVWNGCDLVKDNELGWGLYIPMHFIANHRGGEVKTIDTNTVTLFNERVGLQIKYSFANAFHSCFHEFRLELPYYNYHLQNSNIDNGGGATYPTLTYEWVHWNKYQMRDLSLQATIGYWHGKHYFCSFGNPSFWSGNAYSSLHIPPSATPLNDTRNILTFTVSAEHEFKGLNIGLQVDAYHDLDLKKTDFLFGFYMRFRERFLLL